MCTNTYQLEEIITKVSKEKNADDRDLLEILWDNYSANNTLDMDAVKVKYAEMEPILNSLSKKRKRRLLYLISRICDEYERTGFVEGIRTGCQLILEMLEKT